MKTWKKIIVGVICWTVVVGFFVYETYSIVKKEYVRQTEVANEAREEINFNLDMIKIGVLTGDVETYGNNLSGMREQIAVISSLWLVRSEQEEYLTALSEYAELLENKVALLDEMKKVKTEIVTVKDKINENYGNKDTLTRDKLKEVSAKVLDFKIKPEEYQEEKVLKILNAVNGMVEGISEKAGALAECIDACYKDRINTINDELAEKIKAFADSVKELNSEFEKEFEFERMEELKNNS